MDEPGPSGVKRKKERSPPNLIITPKKKRQKQNPLTACEKQVVINIKKLVIETWPKDQYPSKIDIVKKTAETAGISKATVYNILREKKDTGGVKSPVRPEKKPYKFDLDDISLSGIRRKVHSFYFKNEIPTLDKVLEEVNNDDSLPKMSRSTLHKILTKKLKFKYAKRSRKSALIDRDEIVAWRIRYLNEIRQYRREEKKIYYLDETWVNEGHTKSSVWQDTDIKSKKEAYRAGLSTGLKNPTGKGKRLIILHIGSEDGFVDGGELVFEAKKPDGDYHSEMDAFNFENWFRGLSGKIETGSIIVMDNAPYHSRRVSQVPTSKTKKSDIQQWLRDHNIPFQDSEVRAQLLLKVRDVRHLHQAYAVDELAKEMGFTVVRLPPYHCELNPIELIWAQVKGFIAKENKTFKMNEIKMLLPVAFSKITSDNWKKCIAHVMKEEEKMLSLDSAIDNVVESFIIHVGNSDSESQSESGSDDEIDVVN